MQRSSLASALSRASRAIFAALLVGMLGGACSTPQPLAGYTDTPGASPAGMVLEGTLITSPDSPCLQVKPLGEPAVGLLWPQGYRATSNPVRIYSAEGTEVAAEGDEVTITGEAVYEPQPYCRTETYFEVRQIRKGAGEYAP